VEKKTLFTAAFVLVFLLSVVAGTQLVNLGRANPYSQARDSGVSAAPDGMEPPRISIFSPLNYIVYETSNISLNFKVWVGESANASSMSVYSVHYRADWLQSEIKVNSFELFQAVPEFQQSLSLTGVPSGNHSITVYATETGRYYPDLFHYYRFYLTGSSSVNFVIAASDNASNTSDAREMPVDTLTSLPLITILNPENKTDYRTKDINLTIDVSVGESATASAQFIKEVCYWADWQPNSTIIYLYPETSEWRPETKTEFSKSLNLSGVPEGHHTLTVDVTEKRQYADYHDYSHYLHYRIFEVTGSSTVSFSIDTKGPAIFVLSPQNKTYDTADVPLNFTVNEHVLHIVYSVDGQENVTIAGNTTLTGLPNGDHNVTVYAVDEAGNVGASETIIFSVAPFPTTLVVASVITVPAVSISLLIYFRKRKH
jgi:hypothetical protein